MIVCLSANSYFDLVAALGRPPIHQPQHIQAHVVLATPPQGEAKTCGSSLQNHAVEPGLLLTRTEHRHERCTGNNIHAWKRLCVQVRCRCLSLFSTAVRILNKWQMNFILKSAGWTLGFWLAKIKQCDFLDQEVFCSWFITSGSNCCFFPNISILMTLNIFCFYIPDKKTEASSSLIGKASLAQKLKTIKRSENDMFAFIVADNYFLQKWTWTLNQSFGLLLTWYFCCLDQSVDKWF